MISQLADVPFFRDELATLHAAEWKHLYADWDERSALAEFLNQKADASLPATLVLHEGMELVGSVSVVFGDCPARLDSDDFSPPALVCPKSPRRSVGQIGYCLRFEPTKILSLIFLLLLTSLCF